MANFMSPQKSHLNTRNSIDNEKDDELLPNFILEDVPILEYGNQHIGGRNRVIGTDPYALASRPATSYRHVSDDFNPKMGMGPVNPTLQGYQSQQRSASHSHIPDAKSSQNAADNTVNHIQIPSQLLNVNSGINHGDSPIHLNSSGLVGNRLFIHSSGSQHSQELKHHHSTKELQQNSRPTQYPSESSRVEVEIPFPSAMQGSASFGNPIATPSAPSYLYPEELPFQGNTFVTEGSPSQSIERLGSSSNHISVGFNTQDPSQWTLERVIHFLDTNRFGKDWQSKFRKEGICGEKFLALASYQNLKRLGHFYDRHEDSSPSRFIHVLRKLLNKSESMNSTEGKDMALGFTGLEQESKSSTEEVYAEDSAASLFQSIDATPSQELGMRPSSTTRQHAKSLSTESFTLDRPSSTVNSYLKDDSSKGSTKASSLNDGEEKRKTVLEKLKWSRGLWRDDNRGDLKSPTAVLSIDHRYEPVKDPAISRLLVMTTDNAMFRSIPLTDPGAGTDELKSIVQHELSISSLSGITMHLTDFGCNEGEELDEPTLAYLLRHMSIIKLFVRLPDNLRHEKRYPSTPQYLLNVGSTVEEPQDDYFVDMKSPEDLITQKKPETRIQDDAPEELTSTRPKTSTSTIPRHDRKTTLSPTQQANISPIPTIGQIQNSSTQRSSSSSIHNARSAATTNEDSFKVIRPQRKEINFDDRRASPYERKELRREPSIDQRNSVLVASRPAPPPPPGRRSSVRLTSRSQKSTAESPRSDANFSLSSFSPGQSEHLVPKPYISRKRAIVRKPVNSGTEASSGGSSHSSAGHRSDIKRSGSRSTIASELSFQENNVSFMDAPPFQDGSDSSSEDDDDGLWAKKPADPPRQLGALTLGKPELHVQTVHYSSSPVKSPMSVSSPVLETWAVRPSVDILYDNIGRFFPDADIDKPIINDSSTPPSSPSSTKSYLPALSPVCEPRTPAASTLLLETNAPPRNLFPTIGVMPKPHAPSDVMRSQQLRPPRSRTKSLRIVASEARKRFSQSQENKSGALLRRKSTKFWGQKLVEVRPSQMVQTPRDHSGEFVWIKGDLIGKGTFGKVYLALNVTTKEMMAVKQVEVPRTASDKTNAKQKEIVNALHSEVETMKDLDHLNIVQYLGFEVKDDVYSLFLEYVPGGSIGKILQMHGRIEEEIIRFLTFQVLDGLVYLHSCGILHRDLKADNLLLDLDGFVKISDFGISKKSRDIYANDAEMSMQGTIFWMAPEVVHNVVHNMKQGYSAKIDVWSLGCVVLEMFAGRRPWSTDEAIGAMYKLGTSRQAPPIPDDTIKFVSADAKDFIDQCFTIDPERRPTPPTLRKHTFCTIESAFSFKETRLAHMINSKQRK